MNRQLSEAIAKVRELPDDRQQAAAALLLDFLERDPENELTLEQIAEIERRLAADDWASDSEVKAFFDQMKL